MHATATNESNKPVEPTSAANQSNGHPVGHQKNEYQPTIAHAIYTAAVPPVT